MIAQGAIVAHTRTLAVELAHQGIRVNAIAPGWVTVENYSKAIPDFDEDAARVAARNAVPLGRGGTPLDIAKLAAFLCSDDAEFIIGQTLRIPDESACRFIAQTVILYLTR